MSGKGPSGLFGGTAGDVGPNGQFPLSFTGLPTENAQAATDYKEVNGVSTKLDLDSQGKHIPEHKNYIQGRSIVTVAVETLQSLVNTYAGTGTFHSKSGNEVVDFKTAVGFCINPITNEATMTTWGTIHYSKKKNNCHVVPAMPRKE